MFSKKLLKLSLANILVVIYCVASIFYSLNLVSGVNASLVMNKFCLECTNSSMFPIMHLSIEDLEETKKSFSNADMKINNAEILENAPLHFDLLSSLPWDGFYGERNQGMAGNCWVWAGTGVMESELYRVLGVKDRLSVQYFDSNYNGGIAYKWAGCGGTLSQFANFYNSDLINGGKHMAVSWSNNNANYQDLYSTCESGTGVNASLISTDKHYTFTKMSTISINTTSVSKEIAVNNIKSVLLQGKAVYFSYYLPRGSDWDNFKKF